MGNYCHRESSRFGDIDNNIFCIICIFAVAAVEMRIFLARLLQSYRILL